MLRNLVVNAIEHGEGRDVVVRLATADGAVAVAVRDYGVGLKPGEATRVFNRFWRADPARARTTGGTGLGLSIAVEDARLHGGWLQAWGEPGGGSQFRMTLPRTAGDSLRGSPIPLEPDDSRRNRGLNTSGLPGQGGRPGAGAACGDGRRGGDGGRCHAGAAGRPARPADARDAADAEGAAPAAHGGPGGAAGQRRTSGGAPGHHAGGRRLMGAVGGRGRLLRAALLPVCAALLLAGCSSMPSSGEVRKVGDDGQRADADSQVRVFSIAPTPGESPSDIVSGFLEATTSGETDFATAKKYLSKDEAAQWDPFSRITVLPDQPQSQRGHDRQQPQGRVRDGHAVRHRRQAVVDTKHAYQPEQGPYSASVHLIRQDNQWRIDGLPDGLVLSQLGLPADIPLGEHVLLRPAGPGRAEHARRGADARRRPGVPARTRSTPWSRPSRRCSAVPATGWPPW